MLEGVPAVTEVLTMLLFVLLFCFLVAWYMCREACKDRDAWMKHAEDCLERVRRAVPTPEEVKDELAEMDDALERVEIRLKTIVDGLDRMRQAVQEEAHE